MSSATLSASAAAAARRLGSSSIGWTCATCRNQGGVRREIVQRLPQTRRYGSTKSPSNFVNAKQQQTGGGRSPPSNGRRRAVIWATTGTGVVGGVLGGV